MSARSEFPDCGRPMPAVPAQRLDTARAALAALRHEQRRLERLGLELPLARCREQVRYWEFIAGLLALPPATDPRTLTPWNGGFPWPDASR